MDITVSTAATTEQPGSSWEERLTRFRAACQGAAPPALPALRGWLTGLADDEQQHVLVDLVHEHLRYSWATSSQHFLEEYITAFGDAFPEFATPAVLPCDLIEQEFVVRHRSTGDHPSIADYLRRFPDRDDVAERLQSRCLAQERYVKVEMIGEGGLGLVWSAYDRSLGRFVAIKEPQPDTSGSPEALHSLTREARVTAGLEHPAIVTVHEFQESESDVPFYVMRLVHGRTLRQVIGDYHGPTSVSPSGHKRVLWNQLLRAFTTICDAIAYAHDHGVVHRDLKPQNIVLGDFGETVVLDWGLARRRADAGPHAHEPDATARPQSLTTHPGGTLAYMAPEQLCGDYDQRSDLFGLGAILYEMLTGQPPYADQTEDEATQTLQQRVREARFVEPRRLQPAAPRALEAICLKAMARDPAARYPSALELGAEVQRYLADEPVAAYPEPVFARLQRWARRHRPLVASLATALVLVLAAGGFAAYRVVAEREREREETRREVAKLIAAGLAEGRADQVDDALTRLTEAIDLCAGYENDPVLSLMRAQARHDRERLKQYGQFIRLARSLPAEMVANDYELIAQAMNNRHSSATTLQRRNQRILSLCEQALGLYDVPDNEHWDEALAAGPLLPAQTQEVKAHVADLLSILSFRLALSLSKQDLTEAVRRRALVLLDRAEKLQGITHAILLFRTLHLRGLGLKEEADLVLAQRKQTPLRTAQDHFVRAKLDSELLKKPKDALGDFRQAIFLAPRHFDAHFGLFMTSYALGDRDQQLAALSNCLALHPELPHLWWFRGMVYFELEKHELARFDFHAAIERDPRFAQGYFYRGRMAVALNEKPDTKGWTAGEQDFSRALELDPDLTAAYAWRAMARAKIDRYREAVADAEKAVAAEPDSNITHYYAARAYAQSVRAVRQDQQASDRQQLARQYTERSIELLRQALTLGFKAEDRLAPGSDFDPVREDPGFQALTGEKQSR